ncbi:DUF1771-domain-containing protein [Pluteus cervinus]|uniref:DUF1771-domain-containing protein n=1 Tax=Pluteus cervinus TaxID=181527 RepID=A0ACD3BCG2_9AGAR|nr:DUF1771-domain-containing protein [Pluteus cervinus]
MALLDIFKAILAVFCGATSPQSAQSDADYVAQVPAHGSQPPASVASLRAQANEEGDKMARCFQESHEAYARGDGAAAKALSNEGKAHRASMEQLNDQASHLVFREHNDNRPPGEIDLHGLYVKEAIAFTDQALVNAKNNGSTELRIIVGKGLHSAGGAAKVKPAIAELMQKHRLRAQFDPHNAGVLIVQIGNGQAGDQDVNGLLRNLDRNDEGCTIM